MLNTVSKIYSATRKAPLAIATTLSLYAYELGDERRFPDWPAPFDANQHAAHLLAGVAIGYTGRLVGEFCGLSRRASLVSAVASTAVAGALFETSLSDMLWYRNTTHSSADVLYTAIGGFVGSLCVRTTDNDQN